MKQITISKKNGKKKSLCSKENILQKKGFLLLAPPGTCAGVKKIVFWIFVYVNQV